MSKQHPKAPLKGDDFEATFDAMAKAHQEIEAPTVLTAAWTARSFSQDAKQPAAPPSPLSWRMALHFGSTGLVVACVGVVFWWLQQPVSNPTLRVIGQRSHVIGRTSTRAMRGQRAPSRPSASRGSKLKALAAATIAKGKRGQWRLALAKALHKSISLCVALGRRDVFASPGQQRTRGLETLHHGRGLVSLSISSVLFQQPRVSDCLRKRTTLDFAPYRPLPWRFSFRFVVKGQGARVYFLDTSFGFSRNVRRLFRGCLRRRLPSFTRPQGRWAAKVTLMFLAKGGYALAILPTATGPLRTKMAGSEACIRKGMQKLKFGGTPLFYKHMGRYLHANRLMQWRISIEPGALRPLSISLEKLVTSQRPFPQEP